MTDALNPAQFCEQLTMQEKLAEFLANPAQYRTQLVELLDELDHSAPEDRRCSESDHDEISLTVEALNRTMEHAVSGDNDEREIMNEIAANYWNERGSDSLRKRARSAADDRTPTLNDLQRIALADEIAQELRTCLDEPTISNSTDETVRPSEAGWVSFSDDPWTSARDLAHKATQEMALEARPFVTEAGTGWYGEMSPTGFGQYAPNAGMTPVNAQDSAGEIPLVETADDFSHACTVGTMLDANGEMLPMTDEMLAEARLAVGMRANGAWHSAPLENDRWLTESGLYHGAPSSMTEDEAIDEFGSYETAGEVSHRFDSFNQAADALLAAPATYRAQN